MLVYFFLFGRHLASSVIPHKIRFVFAGAAVYLTYILFHQLDLSFAVSFFLVPVFLLLLFLAINFFDLKTGPMAGKSGMALSETIHKKEA